MCLSQFQLIITLMIPYARSPASLLTSLRQGFLSAKQLYLTMLTSYNKTLRKLPSNHQAETERQVFVNLIKEGPNKATKFMFGIRKNRLFDSQNLNLLEEWVKLSWPGFDSHSQLYALGFLIEQRRESLFVGGESPIDLQVLDPVPRAYYLSILRNAIYKDCKQPSSKHYIAEEALWKTEIRLTKQIGAALRVNEPTGLNRKKRSPLEVEVESLLAALGKPFKRELSINSFSVDFFVDGNFIIEVLGPHHFTVENRLKGQEVMRKLVLEQWYPVRYLSFEELNQTPGLQHKLQLVTNLLSLQCKQSTYL